MSNRRWPRRILLAVVWALAASTWGAIGHHLLGLPDLGALLPVMAAAIALSWPVRVHGLRRALSAAHVN